MSGKAIEAYLKLDKTDTTALAVFNASPGEFLDSTTVPKYNYQSLKTLMGATSDADFYSRITSNTGANLTPVNLGVSIIIQEVDSESVRDTEGYQLDETGAECGYLKILFRTQRSVNNSARYDLIDNVEWRLRLLLDHNWRSKSGNSSKIPLDITNWPDVSLSQRQETNRSMFAAKWLSYSGSGDNVSELVSLYRIEMIRAVGLVDLPGKNFAP